MSALEQANIFSALAAAEPCLFVLALRATGTKERKSALAVLISCREFYDFFQANQLIFCETVREPDGTVKTLLFGERHSFLGQAALVVRGGHQFWYWHGRLHRDDNDQPAVIYADGGRVWYRRDKKHRDNDKPSMIIGGTRYWYQDKVLHRDNGPAIVTADGNQYWFYNGWQCVTDKSTIMGAGARQ